MATKLVHGPHPDFGIPLQPDSAYSITITGHYTTQDGLAAAGVTEIAWHSDRNSKRHAELLALRTAFLHWFVDRCVEFGDSPDDAMCALLEVASSARNRARRADRG